MKKIGKRAKRAFIPYKENDFLPSVLKPRTLFILAVVLLVVKFLIFSWYFYLPKTSQFAIVTSSHLVELANKERIMLGLKPLEINQQLVQAAQQKAQDMLNNNYFNHNSPTGITPWFWLDKTDYKYTAAGENLAKDFTDSEFLHQAWMDSSSHKANIINNKYQEIGIAVIEGEINGKNTVLAVQFFASSHIEAPIDVKEPSFLKGPLVLKQRENLESILGETKNVLNVVKQDSESWTQKVYFVILGLLSLVLTLTVFINIRVQYPKKIFIVLIFIILIAAIALFNGQEFLNKSIEVL